MKAYTTDPRIWDGFVRQRRNLIASSVVLFFGLYAGPLSLNQLHLPSNNTIIFTRTIDITYALWILWTYWTYRYYVYFRDVGDKGFRTTYSTALSRSIKKRAKAFILLQGDLIQEIDKADKIRIAEDPYLANPKLGLWIVHMGDVFRHRYNSNTQKYDTGHIALKYEVPIDSSRKKVLFVLCKAIAWSDTLINTRLLTEFILPFAIAAAPVAYAVYKLA